MNFKKHYLTQLIIKSKYFLMLLPMIIIVACVNTYDEKEIDIIKKTVALYANELSKSYQNHQLNLLPNITTEEELERLNTLIHVINKKNEPLMFSLSKISFHNVEIINSLNATSKTEELWIKHYSSKNSYKKESYLYLVSYTLKKERGIWKVDKVKMSLIK